jgi:hypothetical protein
MCHYLGDLLCSQHAKYSTQQVHAALFPEAIAEPAKTLAQLKQGISQHMQRKHARA